MNTWAVEIVSKLVEESNGWQDFGAKIAQELMRQRAVGMRNGASVICGRVNNISRKHLEFVDQQSRLVERGEA